MLSFNVAVYIASLATVIWSLFDHRLYVTILIAMVWVALILSLKKIKLSIPQMMYSSAYVLIATVITILTVPTKDGNSIIGGLFSSTTKSGVPVEVQKEVTDPVGTIIVDGKTGVLTNGGAWSNISDIERDEGRGEAYLGDGAATATYTVEASSSGRYHLWVKLSDDAQHLNGARSVTITVNGSQILNYSHVSEDTKGWKWYNIGSVSIVEGANTFAFLKDADTSAAYVMNQFKLVP